MREEQAIIRARLAGLQRRVPYSRGRRMLGEQTTDSLVRSVPYKAGNVSRPSLVREPLRSERGEREPFVLDLAGERLCLAQR
jgi:hypothetical protein